MNRPYPPGRLCQPLWGAEFFPAPNVEKWLRQTFISKGGPLCNPDHDHLNFAELGVLWTAQPNARQMREVVGTAEMPFFRGNAWQKGRQEQQLREWFKAVPDFLITLYAPYCAKADDATWCALVEHELYHCGQAVDEFELPKFRKSDGRPVFTLRGHDSEQFVGVVARYGIGAVADGTGRLVEAANREPLIARAQIAGACGTCMRIS